MADARRGAFAPGHLLGWLARGDAAGDAEAAGGPAAGEPFSAVTMSSLLDGQPPMRPGGLFVAYASRRDGHDFVADAFENGARAALVGRVPEKVRAAVDGGSIAVRDARAGAHDGGGDLDGRPLLVIVDDPLRALQGCASWWRRRHRARVLAVAGAVGKTTTKELLANIVAQRYRTLRTAGNFNNELGLPITLLGLTAEHDVAVLEIGISEVGEMATFAAIARPDMAVVTRIVPEHMEHLHDLDVVEREEGGLVEALSPGGVAVLNADDERVARMSARSRAAVVRYGEGAAADVRATDLHVRGLDGLTFKLHAPGRPGGPRDVSLPLVGRHFVTAALAAAAAAFEVGSDWEDVLAGLGRPPQTRRLAPRQLAGGIVLLDDAYNASPDSTCAALDVLAANGQPGGRRLAVLGDMLELGDYAPVAHRQVGLHVPGRAEVLIAVGTLAREIARAARIAGCPDSAVHECASASEAVSLLRQLLQNGDTVLVKASHGMHLEAVVEALGGGDGVSVHG